MFTHTHSVITHFYYTVTANLLYYCHTTAATPTIVAKWLILLFCQRGCTTALITTSTTAAVFITADVYMCITSSVCAKCFMVNVLFTEKCHEVTFSYAIY